MYIYRCTVKDTHAKGEACGETIKASFLYSREMSTEPNPVTAICGFAVYVANEMKDRKGLLFYEDPKERAQTFKLLL